MKVGDNFNPEVGLVRRDDFTRSSATLRFSPRPRRRMRSVRKFTWEAGVENFVNGAGHLETRVWSARFNTELQNSDNFSIETSRNREVLVRPLPIAGVGLPPGDYAFGDAQVSYAFGQQRRASGSVSAQFGHYYDGTLTAIAVSGARVSVLDQLSIEPSVPSTTSRSRTASSRRASCARAPTTRFRRACSRAPYCSSVPLIARLEPT